MSTDAIPQKGRTLSTAQEVLRVLRFLTMRPNGVTPREVANHIGKSPYTAYYLLTTLCREGFALRRKDGRYYATVCAPPSQLLPQRFSYALESLRELAHEINRLSSCRSYLVVLEGGDIYLEGVFGHQGQPGPKGIGSRITPAAHALAVGKAILSLLGRTALDWLPEKLPQFTPNTLDRKGLEEEIEQIRERGLALDQEEYQEGLCCIAVPVWADGQAAALGIAVAKGRFLVQGDKLAALLRGLVQKEVWDGKGFAHGR